MPRVADHNARRRQIAEAITGVIAADGVDAVTVAATAAAAGISVGLVQHYFSTKNDMLSHAYSHVRDRAEQRVDAVIERAHRDGARIEHILLSTLSELLPLDPPRRAECRVRLAFAGRAIDNPGLADVLRSSNTHIRDRIARAIVNGTECGEVPAGTAETAEAAGLLACVDGLTLHLYNDPEAISPGDAADALAHHLRRIFPGVCHQRHPGTGDVPGR